jgi:hypothetical protein
MRVQDQPDPHIVDALVLMRAFFKITSADDRRRVIELAETLARASPALRDHFADDKRRAAKTFLCFAMNATIYL